MTPESVFNHDVLTYLIITATILVVVMIVLCVLFKPIRSYVPIIIIVIPVLSTLFTGPILIANHLDGKYDQANTQNTGCYTTNDTNICFVNDNEIIISKNNTDTTIKYHKMGRNQIVFTQDTDIYTCRFFGNDRFVVDTNDTSRTIYTKINE